MSKIFSIFKILKYIQIAYGIKQLTSVLERKMEG